MGSWKKGKRLQLEGGVARDGGTRGDTYSEESKFGSELRGDKVVLVFFSPHHPSFWGVE